MKLRRALLVLIVLSVAGCKKEEKAKEPGTAEKTGSGTGTGTGSGTAAEPVKTEPTAEPVKAPAATDDAAVCKRYGDLEAKCGGYTGDEIEATRLAASEYCLKARSGEEKDVMAALVKLESVCAASETECEPYAACVEKAKQENDPPAE